MKRLILSVVLLLSLSFLMIFTRHAAAPSNLSETKSGTSSSGQGFNKQAHLLDQPGSIWWIVSKVRPLNPIDYAPSDLVVPKVPLRLGAGDSEMRLRSEPAQALETMISDAKKVNIDLLLASGYRSYHLQLAIYYGYLQQYGQTGADKQSARPGVSENQTGLAADLEPTTRQCEEEECFADLPEGKWLATNAYKYGFVLRYPTGKEAVTGYTYEPWHIRYVGKDLAQEMHILNIQTLEEFFNIVPSSQPY